MSAEHRSNDGIGAAIRWGVLGLAAAVAWAGTAFGWIDWPVVEGWLVQHAVTLSLGGLAMLLLGGAAWQVLPRSRSSHSAPTAARPPLSWWMVAIAVGVVAAVAWGATTGLLHVAMAAKDPAAAQVDAIKTGLSIAAGTGGAFALLLAVRRQWHQELTAADVTLDATARRITELYTKAADQLGSEKAPVRLAGLHALERLAQDNPGQRTTIVQVMCAYLRMPYSPPETTPKPEDTAEQRQEHRDLVQEREVRLTAQRILATHLRPGPDPGHPVTTFWPDISLDLTNATLINLDLAHCHLHFAGFTRAKFVGGTGFAGARFVGSAEFTRAEFVGGAGFAGARFAGGAEFTGARFAGDAWFVGGEFAGSAEFYEAEFAGDAWFDMARFAGDAKFTGATFDGDTRFTGAKFAGTAEFDGAEFARNAVFDMARFAESVEFNEFLLGDESVRERAWCWVRVDVPDAVARSRAWPAGWLVQLPDGFCPPGRAEGQWGRLVHTPDTSTGANRSASETSEDIVAAGTPAPAERTGGAPEP